MYHCYFPLSYPDTVCELLSLNYYKKWERRVIYYFGYLYGRKITVHISCMAQSGVRRSQWKKDQSSFSSFFPETVIHKIKPEPTKTVFPQFSLLCLISVEILSTFWNWVISFQHSVCLFVCFGLLVRSHVLYIYTLGATSQILFFF